MILGIGSDLIEITRIEKTLERFGERFTRRVFTEIERAKARLDQEALASINVMASLTVAIFSAASSGISTPDSDLTMSARVL